MARDTLTSPGVPPPTAGSGSIVDPDVQRLAFSDEELGAVPDSKRITAIVVHCTGVFYDEFSECYKREIYPDENESVSAWVVPATTPLKKVDRFVQGCIRACFDKASYSTRCAVSRALSRREKCLVRLEDQFTTRRESPYQRYLSAREIFEELKVQIRDFGELFGCSLPGGDVAPFSPEPGDSEGRFANWLGNHRLVPLFEDYLDDARRGLKKSAISLERTKRQLGELALEWDVDISCISEPDSRLASRLNSSPARQIAEFTEEFKKFCLKSREMELIWRSWQNWLRDLAKQCVDESSDLLLKELWESICIALAVHQTSSRWVADFSVAARKSNVFSDRALDMFDSVQKRDNEFRVFLDSKGFSML